MEAGTGHGPGLNKESEGADDGIRNVGLQPGKVAFGLRSSAHHFCG